jgi:hypothetical protein
MSSRQTRGRAISVALLAGLVLAACGSTTSKPAPSVSVAVATPSPVALVSPSPLPTPSVSPSVAPSPLPSTTPIDPNVADLTGVTTDPARAHRMTLAVLLDDNRAARPQSGFNGASMVYQAPADGGETRYMFLYQEGDSAQIGPVRSARIYFVHWASETRAAIAHYGGDRRSRSYLRVFDGDRLTNLDALDGSGKAFHRISSRAAPHNGYTSTPALRAMALKHGAPATVPADMYRHTFVPLGTLASRAATERIRIPYRTGLIEYRFDRASDLYRRFVGGAAQVDPADHKAVTTRNVVIMFMAYHTDTKIEPGHSRPVVDSIGSGRAVVIREGHRIEATWSKAYQVAPTRLLDAAGNEIPLVVGRTFFQIVPLGTRISIVP